MAGYRLYKFICLKLGTVKGMLIMIIDWNKKNMADYPIYLELGGVDYDFWFFICSFRMLKKWKLAKSFTPSTSTSSPTRSPKTARGIAIPTTDSSCKEGRGNRAPRTRPASRTFRPSDGVQSRRRPLLRWLARGATDAKSSNRPRLVVTFCIR